MQQIHEFKHKKRRITPSMNPDQRYLWQERFAICIVDGKLTPEQAEKIAWQQYARNVKNCKIPAQLT